MMLREASVVGRRTDRGDAMDIIDKLKREHEELAFLMSEISHLQDGERKTHDYVGSFQRIIAHEGSEEENLYPVLMDRDELFEAGRRGLDEQREIRKAIEELSSMTPDEAAWDRSLGAFRDLLIRHFRTEEDRIFPVVRQTLDPKELAEMTARFEATERVLERHPSPTVNRI